MLIFLSNVLINVDHGSLPGCSSQIERSLNMNEASFGTLGSIVYAGLTLGSMVAVVVYEKASLIKPALFLTLGCNSGAIFLFGISESYLYDIGLRFSVGFF